MGSFKSKLCFIPERPFQAHVHTECEALEGKYELLDQMNLETPSCTPPGPGHLPWKEYI